MTTTPRERSSRSSTPLTRRTLLASVAGIAATGSLVGCAGGKKTVLFHQSKPEAVPYFRDLAVRFTESQGDHRILHDISTNLSASFVRNNPPDLGLLNYNLEMARFMERGALSDLSDLPAAGRIRESIVELSQSYPQYPGRTSVIPYSAMAASVIYNKRIFEDNGIEVPRTWDAFIDICERLKGAGITPIYATFLDTWTIMQGWLDYPVGGMVDVAEFYRAMNQLGPDVRPDSEVSFSSVMLEPVRKMIELTKYCNEDAQSRTYGDGNTAFANDQAAMILQGPWAFGEFEKANKDQDLGTFPFPATNDPADLKVRVNIDLSLWVPDASDAKEGARQFLEFLMQPDIQHPYNAQFLGFGTTKDAPAVTDPRIIGMSEYYEKGQFYMGASQFIPRNIPSYNYFQAIALGADPEPVLAQLDRDWARLAFRD
ncbi:carbohydrate ABC transporter substrate-binding protein [Arachnia propionica]|uniref:Carbohydrate ABC transporter substrate-binding protein n=2 Tax=Arachnia propionica TaxID=1750 RepID=A0A3P1WRX7_9ACTN|nr:carbohydrate ABC transporter substrate-binding protein [Arachnia propionica]